MTPLSRTVSISPQVSRRASGSRPVREFVQYRDLGLSDEGEDDGQALLLTAGEVPEVRAPFRVEAERPEEMVGIAGPPTEGGVELYGFAHPDLGWQGALLELDANALVQP